MDHLAWVAERRDRVEPQLLAHGGQRRVLVAMARQTDEVTAPVSAPR